MVPVLYHDWTVTETGLDIPVSSITVDQFRKLSGKSSSRKQHGSGTSTAPTSPHLENGPTAPVLSVTPPPSKPSGSIIVVGALDKPELPRRSSHQNGSGSPGKENSTRLGRSNSLGAIAKLKSLSTISEPADPSAKMKGNGLGTIQAPFATLKDTFEVSEADSGDDRSCPNVTTLLLTFLCHFFLFKNRRSHLISDSTLKSSTLC